MVLDDYGKKSDLPMYVNENKRETNGRQTDDFAPCMASEHVDQWPVRGREVLSAKQRSSK